MASNGKNPVPPSFYNRMAEMPASTPSPKTEKSSGGSEEGKKIATTLLSVLKQWSSADPKAEKYVSEMTKTLERYAKEVLQVDPKTLGGDGGDGASPAPPPTAGPESAAGSGADAAAGGQPVPA